MIEVKAPNNPTMSGILRHKIFLAGSIEQGTAREWQQELCENLENEKHLVVYNPLRENWDPDLPQTIENEQFNEQVTWELDKMDQSTIIPMYFQAGTNSPITLLELGLYADSKKLVVCCEEGFWRKGNVDIVCNRYGIEQAPNFLSLLEVVRNRLSKPPHNPKAGLPPAKLF